MTNFTGNMGSQDDDTSPQPPPQQKNPADESEDSISFTTWLELFKSHPVLGSKAKTTFANLQKKLARQEIADKLNQITPGIGMTAERVRKFFNNKKSRLLAKTDSSKTGNVDPGLNEEEKAFLDFINGPTASNPSVTKVTGAIDTAGPAFRPTISSRAASSSVNSGDSAGGFNTQDRKRRRSSVDSNSSGQGTAAPPAKRARYDDVYLSLMQEQLTYFRNCNYFFNDLAARVQKIEHFLNSSFNIQLHGNFSNQGSVNSAQSNPNHNVNIDWGSHPETDQLQQL